jgi:hypothetical protein
VVRPLMLNWSPKLPRRQWKEPIQLPTHRDQPPLTAAKWWENWWKGLCLWWPISLTSWNREGNWFFGNGENHRRFVNMKCAFINVLLGVSVMLLVSSCAAVRTEPVAPGGVRLLSMDIPEREGIGQSLPFVVNIHFEADGNPEIRTACFFWSGDGPYCSKKEDMNYGSPGTIKVRLRQERAGMHLLEGYVVYTRDGKTDHTNVVASRIRVWAR